MKLRLRAGSSPRGAELHVPVCTYVHARKRVRVSESGGSTPEWACCFSAQLTARPAAPSPSPGQGRKVHSLGQGCSRRTGPWRPRPGGDPLGLYIYRRLQCADGNRGHVATAGRGCWGDGARHLSKAEKAWSRGWHLLHPPSPAPATAHRGVPYSAPRPGPQGPVTSPGVGNKEIRQPLNAQSPQTAKGRGPPEDARPGWKRLPNVGGSITQGLRVARRAAGGGSPFAQQTPAQVLPTRLEAGA